MKYPTTALHIQLISLHGLIRARDLELGRDADTGGQTRYVVDLATTLGAMDGIAQVDLVTRQIRDARVGFAYARPEEALGGRARIVRIPCGGSSYLPKEELWPHIDEFVDRLSAFNTARGRIPDVVHGHYAEAGLAALSVARRHGVPCLFTAHSLGRNKLEGLLATGKTRQAVDARYHIEHRIDVEEELLGRVDCVVTSTRYERDILYAPYDNAARATFRVIPPGIHVDAPIDDAERPATIARVEAELRRFLRDPDKPLLLSIARPDARKNIMTLVKAFGEDPELRANTNLVVVAGQRGDLREKSPGERSVLENILRAMDRYDLYGSMALPKRFGPEREVPELYRIAARQRGVLVNTSPLDSFGLTLIEAAANGLPVVASNQGGPLDVVHACGHGLNVDVLDARAVADACRVFVRSRRAWDAASRSGLHNARKRYCWHAHGRDYLDLVGELVASRTSLGRAGVCGV